MKIKILSRILLIISVVFSMIGCSVEETIYLGDVEVNGPITPPPTHININKEPGNLTISPRFSFVNNKKINGATDDRYHYNFNLPDNTIYTAKNNNLLWNVSEYTFGADLDVKVSNAVSLFGGLNFSGGKNYHNLTGGNIGIGFHTHQKNPVTRFDAGLNIQQYDYFAVTIVKTKETSLFGSSEHTYICGDKGESVNVNPFFTLTINSAMDSSFINYFGVAGYFTQNLLNFNPGETSYEFFPLMPLYEKTTIDERANFTSGFIYFNPGLIFSFNSQMRLIASAKILTNVNVEIGKIFIIPSIQMDFQL